jgi:ribose 5-phosphate isomerase A
MAQLAGLGCMPVIREAVKKDGPVITDNGNFITDCTFADIRSPENLETAIAAIPGVMESGLFCQFTRKTTIIVGGEKRCRVLTSADVVP